MFITFSYCAHFENLGTKHEKNLLSATKYENQGC
jgi:hypothetical protein